MDIAIWSISGSDVSAKYYSNVTALKNGLLTSWSALDEVVRRSCHSVTSRLELMVKVRGGHLVIGLLQYINNIYIANIYINNIYIANIYILTIYILLIYIYINNINIYLNLCAKFNYPHYGVV